MEEALRKHHISFKNAFSGLFWAVRTQPNFRVHLFLSGVSVVAGLIFKISKIEFLIIVFTIVLGLSAEMINTSLESMTDLITNEWREEAKIAKDVSAGMMLMVALGAAVIAGLIFLPYFGDFLR